MNLSSREHEAILLALRHLQAGLDDVFIDALCEKFSRVSEQ